MFDFIPLKYYTLCFDLLVMTLIFFSFIQCVRGNVFSQQASSINSSMGTLVAAFIILYMGFRNPHGPFGDTVNYARGFWAAAHGNVHFIWGGSSDFLFYNLQRFLAKTTGEISVFFLTCSFVYVGSLWLAMVRVFGDHYYIPFLVILSMFTFWTYGVNGVRNGMGASLFILALTFVDNLPIMFFLFLIALGVHKSVILMIGAATIAWFLKNSQLYLWLWVTAVVASFISGNTIQNYLGALSLFGEDARFSYYMTTDADQLLRWEGVHVNMGFRWDFLAYSAIAVAVGYYFIFKRKFQDEYYHWLYNIYLLTNAFWVLVIRAAFSNRFAQISWFIMPVVLIYPFMKKRFFPNHELMTGVAILVFYAFAFFTNVLIPVIGILQG
jgi:hypothetical protein